MPLPTPIKNEEQNTFISRCISLIKEEFNDPQKTKEENNKQRQAVCFSQWKKSKKEDSVDREFTFRLDKESNLKIDQSTGFLYGKARLTRSGVFDYYDDDCNLMREYRSEEEVFDKESMKSLSMKPIVNDHPSEMITSENVNLFQVGSIGENIERNGTYIESSIIITDKDMVDTILNRKQMNLPTELSCGYKCSVVPEIGHHDSDGYYTFAQKNIKYNHVAIVEKARAGNNVKILDKKQNKKEQVMEKVQFTRKAIKCDSFTMDSITKVINEDNLELVNTLSNKLDEAVDLLLKVISKKDEYEAKYDQAKETISELKSKIDSLNDVNSPVIATMIKERSDVENIAKILNIDCNDKDIKTIKYDSILAVSKNANLKDKSDDYINTRFEAVKDIVIEKEKNDGNNDFFNFMKKVESNKDKIDNDPRTTFIKKDKEQNR